MVNTLREIIIAGDQNGAKVAVQESLSIGMSAKNILDHLVSGMNVIGQRFEDGEIFLPEVMLAADAMTAGISLLEPVLAQQGFNTSKGKVVIGTVEGDIHDIGKNLIGIMLRGNGFQVFDLGKDVPVATYVIKAKEVCANVVGISALMSTTTPGQKKVIEMAKEEGIYGKVKFIVGGACTTPEWAEKIGASYATNAAEAVRVIQSLVKEV